ncbi:MAG: prepilin-type N-terminal cleavage/methylation domain-containing protein [Candidatus Omnitrophota bacterium]|nr:MAG: prepilin-type N-terminal cleavage/methylation domain-containing protein [Candidatus Omnitrophota bacterium]
MTGKKSFTLVELLVVIIIVGILAAVSIPIFRAYIWKARFAEVFATVDLIVSAKRAYRVEHGTYNGIPPYASDSQCYAGNGYAAGSTRVQQDLGIEVDENSFFQYLIYPSGPWPNATVIKFREPGYSLAWVYNYTTKTWYRHTADPDDGGPAEKYFTPP